MLCNELSQTLLKISDSKKSMIQEIRLRCSKPIALTSGKETFFVCRDGSIIYSPGTRAVKCLKHHIFDSFRSLCGYSVYSRQSEITDGYITASNGSRIGVCGTANIKNNEIISVTDITSMNIRIPRQITGVSNELFVKLFPINGGILIAGAPTTGKTTLLRDIAVNVSTGNGCRIMRTAVIDERGELSGGNKGKIDLGLSDIFTGYPKSVGIMQSIRSFSPQLIICDEVGTDKDAEAIMKGANAGAYIIATIHAGSVDELVRRPQTKKLISTGAFKSIVMLDSSDKPGKIKEIIRF